MDRMSNRGVANDVYPAQPLRPQRTHRPDPMESCQIHFMRFSQLYVHSRSQFNGKVGQNAQCSRAPRARLIRIGIADAVSDSAPACLQSGAELYLPRPPLLIARIPAKEVVCKRNVSSCSCSEIGR